MRVRWIGVALAVTLLVLELPGQGRGKDRVRVEVKTGRPAVKIQIGPAGICTRQAPPGHSRGKAWWKTQPGLELQIGRHPGLRGYLLANPKLSLELRIRADADRDGVLTAKECNRFVALARDHCHSAKVKTVAKIPHRNGAAHRSMKPKKPKNTSRRCRGKKARKAKKAGRGSKKSHR